MEKIRLSSKVLEHLIGMHAYIDITPSDFIMTIPIGDVKAARVLQEMLIEAIRGNVGGDC